MSNNWDKENLARKAKETVNNAKNSASAFASGVNASKESIADNLKDAKQNISSNYNSAKHTIQDNMHNAQRSTGGGFPSGMPPKTPSSTPKWVAFLAIGAGALFIWKFREARDLKIRERENLIKQKQ